MKKVRRVFRFICTLTVALTLFATTAFAANHSDYEKANETAQLGAIVMTGSSLCEQFPIDDILEETGDDYVIYNRGYGGYTMTQLMSVLDSVTDLIPSALFINIGTNDIDRLSDDYTYEDMMDNYRTIIETVWEAAPNCVIYMMAYYPCTNYESSGGTITRTLESINTANEYVEALAEELGCNYIDITDVLKDDDGYLKEEYAADTIHLTDEAYEAIYEELKPYFDECVAMETYLNPELVLDSSYTEAAESYEVDIISDAAADITVYEGSSAVVTVNYSGNDEGVAVADISNTDAGVCSASAEGLEITIEALSAGTSTVTAAVSSDSGNTYTVQLNVTVLAEESTKDSGETDTDNTDEGVEYSYSVDLERDATVTQDITIYEGDTATVTLVYSGKADPDFAVDSITDASVCSAEAGGLEITVEGLSAGTSTVTASWTATGTSGSTYTVQLNVTVLAEESTEDSGETDTDNTDADVAYSYSVDLVSDSTVTQDVTIYEGDTATVTLVYSGRADPDFAVDSITDESVCSAEAGGLEITVEGLSAGTSTVTASWTATSTSGAVYTVQLNVTVLSAGNAEDDSEAETAAENYTVDIISDAVQDVSVYEGSSAVVTVNYTGDDGDPDFTIVSNTDEAVCSAAADSAEITIEALSAGTSTVTAGWSTADGNTYTVQINVTVLEAETEEEEDGGSTDDNTNGGDADSDDNDADTDTEVQYSYSVDLERDATVTQDITIYEGTTAVVTLNYSGRDDTVSFSIASNSDESVCSASADTLEITIEGLSAGTSTVIASWTAVNTSGSTYIVQLNVTVLAAEDGGADTEDGDTEDDGSEDTEEGTTPPVIPGDDTDTEDDDTDTEDGDTEDDGSEDTEEGTTPPEIPGDDTDTEDDDADTEDGNTDTEDDGSEDTEEGTTPPEIPGDTDTEDGGDADTEDGDTDTEDDGSTGETEEGTTPPEIPGDDTDTEDSDTDTEGSGDADTEDGDADTEGSGDADTEDADEAGTGNDADADSAGGTGAEDSADAEGDADAGEADGTGTEDTEDAGEAGSADAEDAGEAGSADTEDTADADDADAEETTDSDDTDAEETTDSDDTDTAAEVGDSFSMVLWLALMAAALCTIAALVVRRRFQ